MKKARSRSASQNSLRRHWNHVSRLELLEGREMLNATSELLSLRLAATDLHGNPITQIEQGEAFLIKAYADDRRGEDGVTVIPDPENFVSDLPFGFFTAYFNVTYDSAGFDFDPTYGTGGIKFGPQIISVYEPEAPNVQYDGYIERLGVQNLYTTPITGEIEILSFRMIAQLPGNYQMAEAFTPHFHFDVVRIDDNPNQLPTPYYVNGVPVLDRLTGQDFIEAVDDNDDYFSLHQHGPTIILTEDNQVYFQGIGLQVISSPDADYQLSFVTNPTSTNNTGEVMALPSDVDTIDEWSYFYVEVYAKAPAGNSVQAGFVELNYNPDDFSFVSAIGRSQDASNIRYSITSTVVDEENGTVRIGFNTLSTNLGKDNYALIGRIRMKSDIELPVNYANGELTFTPSSSITLADTNATIRNASTGTYSVINGSATDSHNFEVWPVIYDVGSNGEDRKVGISDFAGFISQYGKLVNDNPQIRKFDFNNNGKVDLADFSLFIQNYGKSDKNPSTRTYPTGYPGDLGGAPLQGSSFILEGEPVDARSTSSATTSTTSTTSPTTAPSQDEPANLSGQTLVTSFPLIESSPTGSTSEGTSQDDSLVSPVEQSTDAVISSLDDQTDLIVMASQDSESSFASEEDETDFAEQTDEVLAIWEDESSL